MMEVNQDHAVAIISLGASQVMAHGGLNSLGGPQAAAHGVLPSLAGPQAGATGGLTSLVGSQVTTPGGLHSVGGGSQEAVPGGLHSLLTSQSLAVTQVKDVVFFSCSRFNLLHFDTSFPIL